MMSMVLRAIVLPKNLDTKSCAPWLLAAKADKAMSIDPLVASNRFVSILCNLVIFVHKGNLFKSENYPFLCINNILVVLLKGASV